MLYMQGFIRAIFVHKNELLYCTWFHGFNGYCTCFRQTMDVLQTDIIFFVDKVKSSIIVASNQLQNSLSRGRVA